MSTIFFSTELVYPPMPAFAIKPDQVRELYNKLHEPGGYPYANLDLQSTVPSMTHRRDSNGLSSCKIGAGKIVIAEDKPATSGMGIDEFVGVVLTVLKGLGPGVGPFVSQKCRVVCTAQPHNFSDSVDFLAGKVANVLDPIKPFGRPPSHFGVRFRFEPVEITVPEAKDPEGELADTSDASEAAEPEKPKKKKKKIEPIVHRGFVTLRFESYSEDIKKVWMEAEAQYIEGMFDVSNLELIEGNIRDTHKFVTSNATRFLDQFDKKE